MPALNLLVPRRESGTPFAFAFLRLRVLMRSGRLDRLLAEGHSPTSDPRLALRAAQLSRPGRRAGFAAALRDGVRSVDETALTLRRRPQARVDTASVHSCASEIGELASALTDINPRVRGIAMVSVLLTDGLGPLYASGRAERLHDTIVT